MMFIRFPNNTVHFILIKFFPLFNLNYDFNLDLK